MIDQKIAIHEKLLDETLNGIKVYKSFISYNGIDTVNLEEISLSSLLVTSKLSVKQITLNQSFQSFLPINYDFIILEHFLWDPLHIYIQSEFSQGSINGTVDLETKIAKLNIIAEKNFLAKYPLVKKQLTYIDKDDNNERYEYEFKF